MTKIKIFNENLSPTDSICPQTIRDYIAAGRSRVLWTKDDPYAHILNSNKLLAKMDADARSIFDWFSRLTTKSARRAAAKKILAIQFGPKHYFWSQRKKVAK